MGQAPTSVVFQECFVYMVNTRVTVPSQLLETGFPLPQLQCQNRKGRGLYRYVL